MAGRWHASLKGRMATVSINTFIFLFPICHLSRTSHDKPYFISPLHWYACGAAAFGTCPRRAACKWLSRETFKETLLHWHMKTSSRSSVTGENHFCSVVIKEWINAYYGRKSDSVFGAVLAVKRFQCKNCVVLPASASVEAGPFFTSLNYLLLQLSATIKDRFGQRDEGREPMNRKLSWLQAGVKSERCRWQFDQASSFRLVLQCTGTDLLHGELLLLLNAYLQTHK